MDFDDFDDPTIVDCGTIEFFNFEGTTIKEDPKPEPVSIYTRNGKPIEFDEQTMEYYRALRKGEFDAISYAEVPSNLAFKFEYQWDPLTGERLSEKDPFGPLTFDVHYLIKYFYTKRLEKLWVNPVDENGGYYQGYYDDGVNAGEDFFLKGRGHHPEWYLFRIPIPDCYLTNDHNKQFITFGPKLSHKELEEIYSIAKKDKHRYNQLFKKKMPDLMEMENLYLLAISKNTDAKTSRQAVDRLVKMVG